MIRSATVFTAIASFTFRVGENTDIVVINQGIFSGHKGFKGKAITKEVGVTKEGNLVVIFNDDTKETYYGLPFIIEEGP